MNPVLATAPCPCGSGLTYGGCCEPYVTGQALAPTAETLMRSRYTAYGVGQGDYLWATHHPAARPADLRAALRQSMAATTWLGLQILHVEQGQPSDRAGVVEFIAHYQAGERGQIHERSRFQKLKDRWFYVEGDHLPPVYPQRNAPCWCGSGDKFKHCHG